jgi:hypothetical protein
MRAQMPPASQAVAASAADHMTFATHQIAGAKIADVRSHLNDFADKFMTDGHWYGDGALRPIVPAVDMNIGAANARAPDADQNIVDANGGFGDLFEPQTGLALALYKGFHVDWMGSRRIAPAFLLHHERE